MLPLVRSKRLHRQRGLALKLVFSINYPFYSRRDDLLILRDASRQSPVVPEMDMHEITEFGIVITKRTRPLVIYLDYVYLSQ